MDALLRYDERPADGDWADVLATFPLFAGVGKRQLRKLVRKSNLRRACSSRETVLELARQVGRLLIVWVADPDGNPIQIVQPLRVDVGS